jgi:hypothetical protein
MGTKPYHLMTVSEKIAARIAKNQQIEARIERKQAPVMAARRAANSAAVAELELIAGAFLATADYMDNDSLAAGLGYMARIARRIR